MYYCYRIVVVETQVMETESQTANDKAIERAPNALAYLTLVIESKSGTNFDRRGLIKEPYQDRDRYYLNFTGNTEECGKASRFVNNLYHGFDINEWVQHKKSDDTVQLDITQLIEDPQKLHNIAKTLARRNAIAGAGIGAVLLGSGYAVGHYGVHQINANNNFIEGTSEIVGGAVTAAEGVQRIHNSTERLRLNIAPKMSQKRAFRELVVLFLEQFFQHGILQSDCPQKIPRTFPSSNLLDEGPSR